MAPIRYRLSMPEPHTHLFRVEIRWVATGEDVVLFLPSWTPGSYLLREFPRNVQEFAAEADDGTPLPWHKADKNRWTVGAAAGGEVVVRYAVYANELTVRTSHLDASHGYVNGASVFMAAEGADDGPLELEVEAPPGWTVTTPLPAGGSGTWTATDYRHLIDSPIEIGAHRVIDFQVDEVPHRYAIWGRGSFDAARLVRDTSAVVQSARQFWGSLPYSHYTFFVHLVPGGRGGLEHRESTSLHTDRFAFDGPEYEQYLALVTHEFFHTWNGTRIRPEPLVRPDLTREAYTRNLWVVEGLTTYYTDILLCRAGLITAERYLERLSEAIERHRALPGRHVQTLAEASFDTWIKFYRPDEHTPNAQVSYYAKGALVGLVLDMEIRRATANARSLDDVLRLLWERFGSRDVGYPERMADGVQAVAEEVAGGPLDRFFDRYVFGLDELPLEEALEVAGVRPRHGDEAAESAAGAAAAVPSAGVTHGLSAAARAVTPPAALLRLGIRTEGGSGGFPLVSHVRAGSAAHRGGVNARDVLLAVDGVRADGTDVERMLATAPAAGHHELTVLRRGELLGVRIADDSDLPHATRLERVPDPSASQAAVWAAWLGRDEVAAGS